MILHCPPGGGGRVVELEYRTINVYKSKTVDDHGPKLGDLSTQLGSGFSESFETQAGIGSYGLWKTEAPHRRDSSTGTRIRRSGRGLGLGKEPDAGYVTITSSAPPRYLAENGGRSYIVFYALVESLFCGITPTTACHLPVLTSRASTFV